MARLDPSRTALELDEVELTVANLLLTSPDDELLRTPISVKTVAELERAGVAEDRVIGGYAARMLAVVLGPELRLIVERFAAIETQRDIAATRGGLWRLGREPAERRDGIHAGRAGSHSVGGRAGCGIGTAGPSDARS